MEPAPKSTTQIDNEDYSLPDLDQTTWQRLTAAPAEKENGFNTFVLATITTDSLAPDGLPDARTVVLRQADERSKTLWFHTDVRAQKVTQLQDQPAALLLFWDQKKRVQLRCWVSTTIHTDDAVADEQWTKIGEGSRKMYLSEHEPGSLQPNAYPGFPVQLGANLPTRAESEAGRPNFAVVACKVLTMEYLHLNRAGQTRARFDYRGEDISRNWLAP